MNQSDEHFNVWNLSKYSLDGCRCVFCLSLCVHWSVVWVCQDGVGCVDYISLCYTGHLQQLEHAGVQPRCSHRLAPAVDSLCFLYYRFHRMGHCSPTAAFYGSTLFSSCSIALVVLHIKILWCGLLMLSNACTLVCTDQLEIQSWSWWLARSLQPVFKFTPLTQRHCLREAFCYCIAPVSVSPPFQVRHKGPQNKIQTPWHQTI